jgi:hypothetical protein
MRFDDTLQYVTAIFDATQASSLWHHARIFVGISLQVFWSHPLPCPFVHSATLTYIYNSPDTIDFVGLCSLRLEFHQYKTLHFSKMPESLDAGGYHQATLALTLLPECARKDALVVVIVSIIVLGQAWLLRCVYVFFFEHLVLGALSTVCILFRQ